MNLIYDFETLSQNAFNGAIVSVAALHFDPERFIEDPYDYMELIGEAKTMKFDVAEQVEKYGRKIEKETLEWWKKQSKEAQQQLKPSKLDQPIEMLYTFMFDWMDIDDMNRVYTRGNSFDPVLLDSICDTIGKPRPTKWWAVRDTRSTLEGMLWGSGIKDKFIPEGLEDLFVGHDPSHDIAMDVCRIQHVVRVLNG